MADYYTQERIENISRIMPTYAAFVRKGDAVYMGLTGDPLYPFENDRPSGVVHSVHGPPGARVVNVRLDDKYGGKMAHCDERTLNPYLVFQPNEATYQRALDRADAEPATQQRLRAEMEHNDVVFRSTFGASSSPGDDDAASVASSYRNAADDASSDERYRAVQDAIEETRKVTMEAILGLARDVRGMVSREEATYAGRLLSSFEDERDDDDASVVFRGIESDSASDSASDDDDAFLR